jgi:cardiolipin synthase
LNTESLYTQNLPAPHWDYEELYFSGDDYFKSLLRAIHDAQYSIRFETYIYNDDKIGEEVTYALYKAAKRGVSTHIIVDGVGSLRLEPSASRISA